MDIADIVRENERRKALLTRREVPKHFRRAADAEAELRKLKNDFEYWCYRCVIIRDKITGRNVPFRLNYAQRQALKIMDEQRRQNLPIRIIMLKARQWGGSTLVQMYMAWIQIMHRRNWNSMICAQSKETSAQIRGMYSLMLNCYPQELWQEKEKPEFRSYERSMNTRLIPGRGCKVTLATAENQEGSRGYDVSMAHLSEVAFYKRTLNRAPQDVVRAICSGIPLEPYTMIALESTANGQGNYFHDEWQRAVTDQSDKKAIFVPWHMIAIYSQRVNDPQAMVEEMTEYERTILWEREGCSLEQIAWYHAKSSEYSDPVSMMREFPTTAQEAFESTTCTVFAPAWLEKMRPGISTPVSGYLHEGKFIEDIHGKTMIWEKPQPAGRYVVGVDIGGRSAKADYSVIVVINYDDPEKMRVAAQWRDHDDMDLVGKLAASIASYYNNALLVVESNTLESDRTEEGAYVLDRLSKNYRNLYRRNQGTRPGFHTNRATKGAVISNMIEVLRDNRLTERDAGAMAEMSQYERQENGVFAARMGCHDDMVMARAIALYAVASEPERRQLKDEQINVFTSRGGWL